MEENYKKYLDSRLDLIFEAEKGLTPYNHVYQIEKQYEENGICDSGIWICCQSGLEYVYGPDNNKLSKKGYYRIHEFRNGRAVVEERTSPYTYEYNFINYHGDLISDEWFDEVTFFSTDVALVRRCNHKIWEQEYNFIDRNGNMLFSEWLSYVSCPVEYWALDSDNFIKIRNRAGKYNLISTNGKVMFDEWVNDIHFLDDCTWMVEKSHGKLNAIDFRGKFLFENDFENKNDLLDAFAKIKGHLFSKYLEYKKDRSKKTTKNIKKILAGSSKNCTSKKLHFGKYAIASSSKTLSNLKLDYMPTYIYNGYILCESSNKCKYLYDIKTGVYEFIGYDDTSNDEHLIYGRHHVYLMYEGKKIEITDYHSRKLNDTIDLKINSGINIMSLSEFEEFMKNMQDGYRTKSTISMMSLKEQEELLKKEKVQEFGELLKVFQVNANKLNALKNELGNIKVKRVIVDEVLIEKGNHKEVVDYLKPYLRFIDLSVISFKNVDMEGLDLKDTNINLYPQEVYKKSLKGCDLTGINLTFMNLDGVDIRGAKLSRDDNPHTIDMIPNFKKSIYDASTMYDGSSVEELIIQKMKKKIN